MLNKWKATILADRESQAPIAKLLNELSKRDDSFGWNWAQREGDLVIEVTSRNEDQAYKRAEWLTKKTQLFYNAPYLVEEIVPIYDSAKRPRTVERLQDHWKRIGK